MRESLLVSFNNRWTASNKSCRLKGSKGTNFCNYWFSCRISSWKILYVKSYLSLKSSWTNPKKRNPFGAIKCKVAPLEATTRAAKGLVWKGELCGPDDGIPLLLHLFLSPFRGRQLFPDLWLAPGWGKLRVVCVEEERTRREKEFLQWKGSGKRHKMMKLKKIALKGAGDTGFSNCTG